MGASIYPLLSAQKLFLSSSGLGGGKGVQGRTWIIVYEHGYKKRKDQRTESQTECKIQYFTFASISSLENP